METHENKMGVMPIGKLLIGMSLPMMIFVKIVFPVDCSNRSKQICRKIPKENTVQTVR